MGGRATGVRLALAGVVAAQAALVPAVVRANQSPPPPPPVTRVTVDACSPLGRVVPLDYLGLSIEWSMVPHWFGTSTDTAVASTVSLLRSLTATPLTGGVLRIGGSSQDGYRWTPNGDTTGNRLFFGKVTPGMVDALLEVARQSGWKLVLGLNLRDDQPEEAAALVRYAVTKDTAGSLLAVAPGNEPEEYLPRKEDYLARFDRYADALAADPLTRGVRLTGPDVSNGADLSLIADLRRDHQSRLAFVGWHDYANRPSLAKLLAPEVQARFVQRLTAAAEAASLTPSRMSEGNSVGRGGLGRVSDVTGSTAWTIDTMLTGASSGLAGYNLHAWDNHYYMQPGWKARYTPFFVRGGMAFPAPGVYALALLKHAPGRRFCSVTTVAPPGGTTKAWALSGLADRRLALYLINKGTTSAQSSRVSVALPPSYDGPVTASWIHDVRGCGGRGTTINGSPLQRSGVLTWAPRTLQRAADGTVEVPLAPCQTALLLVDRDEDGSESLPAPL